MNTNFKANLQIKSSVEDIQKKFKNLSSFDDVSDLLEISPKHLRYILFEMKDRYKSFEIPKKNGETRSIVAPSKSIKILQRKLNYILSLNYSNRPTSHGFIKGKSIVTNAQPHVKQSVVLNFDLKDFFSTINFGRVRGVFIKFFDIGDDAATVLANICCKDNVLPQGAPTSPIISNIVCYKLDKELLKFAKKHSCVYTRYADDITLSTNKKHFPNEMIQLNKQTYTLSKSLFNKIENNGFKINDNKTRIRYCSQRMEVTGLTVNEKPNVTRHYIRNIRAIIRSIEKYGLEVAQEIHEGKYIKIHLKSTPQITNLLIGKLNYVKMVRGIEDSVFNKLAKRFNKAMGDELVETYKSKRELRELHTYVVDCGFIVDGEFINESQGSGFFLKGVGFVTNAHVVKLYKENNSNELPYEIRIHRSRYSDTVLKAILTIYNRDLDIAILNVEGFNSDYGYSYNLDNEYGQEIRVMGYPNHNKRDSLATDSGEIKQYRDNYLKETVNQETGELGDFQERFVVSARIVDGNSGGPVINNDDEVIGIATKGFRTLTDSGYDEDTDTSIAVKIEDVIKLIESKDQKDLNYQHY
ncbi:reverse transcriptase domain-containing protein [Salibacterium aidingense]|uniref:reverse transcriptase domain-containing protein n=1 Tax=Salibacterium aidingense TaxID=384933 RepID=UPI0006888637|nr:reverse transcriptase domain-containing protein [Salibacterium aidingense]